VPKSVAGGGLREEGVSNGSLEDRLVQVVAPATSGLKMAVEPGRGKNPLPSPFPRGPGILPLDGRRQFDTSPPALEVPSVDSMDLNEVIPKGSGIRNRASGTGATTRGEALKDGSAQLAYPRWPRRDARSCPRARPYRTSRCSRALRRYHPRYHDLLVRGGGNRAVTFGTRYCPPRASG
jgi:hypothetical protein